MKYILFLFLLLNTFLNAQWTELKSPDTSAIFFTSIITVNNNLIAGTLVNGIYKYSGDNWIQINKGIKNWGIISLAFNDNYIYVGTSAAKEDSAGVFISTNYGDEWINISNGILPGTHGTRFAFNNNEIFVGGYYPDVGEENGSVYRSINNGQNWEEIFSGGDMGIVSLFISNKYIITGSHYGTAYSSRVDTILWYTIPFLSGTHLNSIVRSGEFLLSGTDEGLFYSTDEGENWYQSNPTPLQHLYAYNNYVYASTIFSDSEKALRSDDYGQTWSSITDELQFDVTGFTVLGDFLYAATSNGVWSRSLKPVNILEPSENSIPMNYSLSQNYPNPFNPNTVINYTILFESNIVFNIYNSLGQKIKSFSEGIRSPGSYELNVSSSNLSSGVYFYTINAFPTDGRNNFTDSKKMIILK